MTMEDSVLGLERGVYASPAAWRRYGRMVGEAMIISVLWTAHAVADPEPQTISGVPVQIIPQVGEVGLPAFSIPPGTVSIGGTPVSIGTADPGTGGTGASGSTALDTMLNQSWGLAAEQSSEALGINPSATAATCVIESGCENLGAPGSAGKITGAFQMSPDTYNSMIAAALKDDPGLASSIVPGLAGQNDPATQAVAAAEYLKQGAQYLQNNGVSDPSVLDVRGYYNFGPQGGYQLATADPDALMSDTLTGFSASTLAKNGITPGETVGQWKANVSSKIGNAATASVLAS